MGVSAPVPDQSRAGLQHDTGIAANAGFLRAYGQLLQAAPQHPARPAIGALLQVIGEGSDQQIATEAQRRVSAMQPAPSQPQIVG